MPAAGRQLFETRDEVVLSWMSQTSAASTPEQLVEAVRNAGPANLAPLQDARLFLYSRTVEPSAFVALGGVKVLAWQPKHSKLSGTQASAGCLLLTSERFAGTQNTCPVSRPEDQRQGC